MGTEEYYRLKLEAHKAKAAAIEDNTCMLCGAFGNDKRSLFIDCGYDVSEAVDEAIDINALPDHHYHSHGYYLLLCKTCRGELLTYLRQWAALCRMKRGMPMNHDGEITLPNGNDRNIPVRIMGAIHMMTIEEFMQWKSQQK